MNWPTPRNVTNVRYFMGLAGYYRRFIEGFSKVAHAITSLQKLEEISTQNGPLTLTQIPCHHVLANEISLNLKYHIGLKQIFNINLVIGIIKKTTFFVCIFHISPSVFTQISIERACWMRN